MTTPQDRAKQLIAKALDQATPVEEARSCALIAVRLIDDYEMLKTPAPTSPPPPAVHRRERTWDEVMNHVHRRRARVPRSEPSPAWWDVLPSELWIFSARQCIVCQKSCAEGSRVWAIELGKPDPNSQMINVRVCHLECKDSLPRDQRGPKRRS